MPSSASEWARAKALDIIHAVFTYVIGTKPLQDRIAQALDAAREQGRREEREANEGLLGLAMDFLRRAIEKHPCRGCKNPCLSCETSGFMASVALRPAAIRAPEGETETEYVQPSADCMKCKARHPLGQAWLICTRVVGHEGEHAHGGVPFPKPEPPCSTCGKWDRDGLVPAHPDYTAQDDRWVPCPDCRGGVPMTQPTREAREAADVFRDAHLLEIESDGHREVIHGYLMQALDAFAQPWRERVEGQSKELTDLRRHVHHCNCESLQEHVDECLPEYMHADSAHGTPEPFNDVERIEEAGREINRLRARVGELEKLVEALERKDETMLNAGVGMIQVERREANKWKARAERAEAALASLEWKPTDTDGTPFCPWCDQFKPNGHDKDCIFARQALGEGA